MGTCEGHAADVSWRSPEPALIGLSDLRWPEKSDVQIKATVNATITPLVLQAMAFAIHEFLWEPMRSARLTSFSIYNKTNGRRIPLATWES